jgi:hypothetical protein
VSCGYCDRPLIGRTVRARYCPTVCRMAAFRASRIKVRIPAPAGRRAHRSVSQAPRSADQPFSVGIATAGIAAAGSTSFNVDQTWFLSAPSITGTSIRLEALAAPLGLALAIPQPILPTYADAATDAAMMHPEDGTMAGATRLMAWVRLAVSVVMRYRLAVPACGTSNGLRLGQMAKAIRDAASIYSRAGFFKEINAPSPTLPSAYTQHATRLYPVSRSFAA